MNSRLALASILAMGTVGEVFIYLVPILLGSVVDSFTLREGTAGMIIGLEIAASSVAAIALSSQINRLPLRKIGIASLAVVIIGDLLSSVANSIEVFLTLRILAAFGAGATFALANSLAANTRQPEKTYALLGISVILAATIGFIVLTYAISNFGPQSAFAALAALTSLAIPFVLWLPKYEAEVTSEGSQIKPQAMRLMAVAMLMSVLLLYVGQNAVWVFVERIGSGIGLALPLISTILIINGFLALLGPFLAHRLGTSFGRIAPILVAMAIQIVTIIILVQSFDQYSYAISLVVLSLAYVFVIPYFRGVMAKLDSNGRVVGISTAFVTIGAAVGPAFGGVVLNMGGTYATLGWVSVSLFILALVLVLPVAKWADRRPQAQSEIAG